MSMASVTGGLTSQIGDMKREKELTEGSALSLLALDQPEFR
jgi:hypothetical protein